MFSHVAAYENSKELTKRSVSDKILKYGTYEFAIYPKYDWIHWARTHNHLIHKRKRNHLAKMTKWLNCVVTVCTMYLIVCSYHVAYGFQGESILYCCLNVKELLARSRHENWLSLSECNWTGTYNHLVHKWTLNH